MLQKGLGDLVLVSKFQPHSEHPEHLIKEPGLAEFRLEYLLTTTQQHAHAHAVMTCIAEGHGITPTDMQPYTFQLHAGDKIVVEDADDSTSAFQSPRAANLSSPGTPGAASSVGPSVSEAATPIPTATAGGAAEAEAASPGSIVSPSRPSPEGGSGGLRVLETNEVATSPGDDAVKIGKKNLVSLTSIRLKFASKFLPTKTPARHRTRT